MRNQTLGKIILIIASLLTISYSTFFFFMADISITGFPSLIGDYLTPQGIKPETVFFWVLGGLYILYPIGILVLLFIKKGLPRIIEYITVCMGLTPVILILLYLISVLLS